MDIRLIGLTAGIVSAIIAYISTPFVIKLAKKIGIVDDPKKNKHPKVIHTRPTPRGGGLAVFIGIFAGSLIFLPFNKKILAILLSASVVVFAGIHDDKYNTNPYKRLLIQFVAAGIPILAGIGIAFVSRPAFFGQVPILQTYFSSEIIDLSHPQVLFEVFGVVKSIWVISDLLALFWIVFLMNILNMGAKGISGQLPGVTAIAAITIAILSLQFAGDTTQWPVIILAAITAGAFLGFLPWNFFPQKIMPGWSGSTLAGLMLAVLSILATAKVGTLLVVLGIPIIDTCYTIARRIVSGKSPVWGDRGHLHHKLLDAGLSKKQVVYFYWGGTALLGAIAINLNTNSKLYTIVGVATLLGGLLIWLTYSINRQE